MGDPSKKPNISTGLLAHVDAGKTTLSEALLYVSGAKRSLGRVDRGDSLLDSHALERSRGITIFSKQARLEMDGLEITLVDTPGHVDLSAEAERTLSILDCAVLLISGTDGVQAHTLTLWRLLEQYQVPTFLFINKMDLPVPDRQKLMEQLQQSLSPQCVDFTDPWEQVLENAALCDEALLETFLSGGQITDGNLGGLIGRRKLFPCCFGSGLKLTGVEEFLDILTRLAPRPNYGSDFGGRVYKISRDPQGNRLTWLKVTGGTLPVRTILPGTGEKINQIRLYSGEKFTPVEAAAPGTLCAITGPQETYVGQGLGTEPVGNPPVLQSVMSYRVCSAVDPVKLLPLLRQLEEEDPQLQILWDDHLKQIHVQIMGRVQLEILRSLVKQRFNMDITLEEPRVFYKETIENTVEGVGHFEPLRHYAEAHILLEPLPRGSGLVFDTRCPTDVLDGSYQSLIMGHMSEKVHKGVLIDAPITDMKLTLVSGRAHLKHTEGGDFRQATYRAIRQGLMQAKSVVLEPWYDFVLTIPTAQVGRAISDIREMSGRFDPPEAVGEVSTLRGSLPASELGDYPDRLAAFTQGMGRLQLTLGGYEPCHNTEAVVAAADYNPEADLENTPDSVFCAHGAGFTVKWHEVKNYMHLESSLKEEKPQLIPHNLTAEDKSLEAVLKREFGDIKTELYRPVSRNATETLTIRPPRKSCLIVDGYNIVFGWPSLKQLAQEDLDAARRRLCDRLSSYAGFKKCELVLVFDGYQNKGSKGERSHQNNIRLVYTPEGQTADAYIEGLAADIGRNYQLWVVSSDALVQLSSLGSGVLRMSARELEEEVIRAENEMKKYY